LNSHNPQPQAMIFDLDGTLLQTETLILPAYHATFDQLRQEGLFQGETPPESRILGALGMLLDDIFHKVMPEASQEAKTRANVLLLQHQLAGLERGDGVLYPAVLETLTQLHSRGIRLFVASNGLEEYVREVIKRKGIAHVFEGLYSAGQYKTKSKVDLVRIIIEHHNISSAWMVGDRSSDVEAGVKNELPVVGCTYAGFGQDSELSGCTHLIYRFEEILEIGK
jgi:phosphoglycolate phosphatase